MGLLQANRCLAGLGGGELEGPTRQVARVGRRAGQLLMLLTAHPEERPMQTITTIGFDIAKSVFQVNGVDAAGETILRRAPRLLPARPEAQS